MTKFVGHLFVAFLVAGAITLGFDLGGWEAASVGFACGIVIPNILLAAWR